MAQPIPQGFSTITPTLMLSDAKSAIELYKKAFGATEDGETLLCPETGKVMHATLNVGDSKLFVSDEMPGCGGVTKDARFCLYVKDCDASMKKAVAAGCSEEMKAEDMFWGDRMGSVRDKFGIQWSIATHIKDMSADEIKKGRDEWMAKMKSKGSKAA